MPEPARLLLQHIITSATVPTTGVTMMAQCSVCTKTYSTIAIYTTYCNLYNRTIQHDQCHNDSESSDCDLVTHVSLSFPLCIALHSKVSQSQCKHVHHNLDTYIWYANCILQSLQHDRTNDWCHNDSESSDCDLGDTLSLAFRLCIALLFILKLHNHNAITCIITCTLTM